MAVSKPKSQRAQVILKLSAEAKAITESLRDDTGVSNVAAMERLLEWFAGLDRRFRLAILNRDEDTRRELALDALAKMSGQPLTPDQLAAVRARAIDLDPLELAALITDLSRQLEALLKDRQIQDRNRDKDGKQ
jgi:hypothetical protein